MSDGFFKLNIDLQKVHNITKNFLLLDPKVVRQSHNAALRKSADYLKRISTKELSTELKLAINILRNRISAYRRQGVGNMDKMKLFYGLNKISLRYLDPKQTTAGVKTKPVEVKGAFIAKISDKAGFRNVYKRQGRKRFPVEAQYYELNVKSDDVGAILQKQVNAWHDIYIKELERNLLWRSSRQ